MAHTKQTKEPRREVRQADFVRNPGATMSRAAHEGPVVLTSANGTPRMMICVPTDERPLK